MSFVGHHGEVGRPVPGSDPPGWSEADAKPASGDRWWFWELASHRGSVHVRAGGIVQGCLMEELRDAGVPGDVLVNSTLEGRMLEVVVEDLESLPGSFGVNVPEDMYVVVEGETSREGVTPIILSASVNTRIATRRTAIAFGSFAYRRGARCC